MSKKYIIENTTETVEHLEREGFSKILISEGCLLDNYLFYKEGYKLVVLEEKYASAWSSIYEMSRFNKCPKKYEQILKDYLESNEEKVLNFDAENEEEIKEIENLNKTSYEVENFINNKNFNTKIYFIKYKRTEFSKEKYKIFYISEVIDKGLKLKKIKNCTLKEDVIKRAYLNSDFYNMEKMLTSIEKQLN